MVSLCLECLFIMYKLFYVSPDSLSLRDAALRIANGGICRLWYACLVVAEVDLLYTSCRKTSYVVTCEFMYTF